MTPTQRTLEREVVELTLPFPPSVNHYWRRLGNRYFISEDGQSFRAAVGNIVLAESLTNGLRPFQCHVEMEVDLHPPDNRRRDVDNFGGKAIGDSLKHAGLYLDDSQIKKLTVEMREVVKGGKAVVRIRERKTK